MRKGLICRRERKDEWKGRKRNKRIKEKESNKNGEKKGQDGAGYKYGEREGGIETNFKGSRPRGFEDQDDGWIINGDEWRWNMDIVQRTSKNVPVEDSLESPDRPGIDAQNTTENWTAVVETPWDALLFLVVDACSLFLVTATCRSYSVYVPAPVLVPVQVRGKPSILAFSNEMTPKISAGGRWGRSKKEARRERKADDKNNKKNKE